MGLWGDKTSGTASLVGSRWTQEKHPHGVDGAAHGRCSRSGSTLMPFPGMSPRFSSWLKGSPAGPSQMRTPRKRAYLSPVRSQGGTSSSLHLHPAGLVGTTSYTEGQASCGHIQRTPFAVQLVCDEGCPPVPSCLLLRPHDKQGWPARGSHPKPGDSDKACLPLSMGLLFEVRLRADSRCVVLICYLEGVWFLSFPDKSETGTCIQAVGSVHRNRVAQGSEAHTGVGPGGRAAGRGSTPLPRPLAQMPRHADTRAQRIRGFTWQSACKALKGPAQLCLAWRVKRAESMTPSSHPMRRDPSPAVGRKGPPDPPGQPMPGASPCCNSGPRPVASTTASPQLMEAGSSHPLPYRLQAARPIS